MIDEAGASDEETLIEQNISSQFCAANRGGHHGIVGGFIPVAQSTPITSRGSIYARCYGNVGTRSAPPASPDSTPVAVFPPHVKPQDKELSREMHLPLWEDADVNTLRWEDPSKDKSANQILGRHHHVFLKKRSRIGIRVIIFGRQEAVVDFEAPPLINSPVPRLHFDDLLLLLPSVMCIQFILGPQFRFPGKMVAVHVDLKSEVNVVSGKILPPPNKLAHKKVPLTEFSLNFGQYSLVQVDTKVSLAIRGREDMSQVARFDFEAYVVSQRRLEHFPWGRLILGREFVRKLVVGMHGDTNKGQLYMEDERRTFYGQSYQRKSSSL